jgi:hypothetical protein
VLLLSLVLENLKKQAKGKIAVSSSEKDKLLIILKRIE